MALTRFVYAPPTSGEHKVGICGDFTAWEIKPLENRGGVYEIVLDLKEAVYRYKLIVDGIWMADPANSETEADPFGGFNSILRLGDLAAVSGEQRIAEFEVPRWVQQGIVYQIFPDRFYNGNHLNDPDFSESYYQDCKHEPKTGDMLPPQTEYYHLVTDWKDISGLTQNPYLPIGKPDWWSFYGGDIAGVIQKLDYLVDLGVSIIYFNPLWKAKSNHKYDSADYMSIDPHFGTVYEMQDLVRKAHAKGIRIILDVAFNHTGETFWAFRDCVDRGQKSLWWNWYDWKKWPLPKPLPADFKPKDYYQCWWGIKDMPDLNYDLSRTHPEENAVKNVAEACPNPGLIEHLMQVTRWWLLEIDIDGFRLDVPDEVPYWFWELFRTEVKKCKPDAWLVGELWNNAREWVSPRYFDSVMNYAYFKSPVHELFIQHNITIDEFKYRIMQGLAVYPLPSLKAMMNILGSHDTWRIAELTLEHPSRLKLAILFQMTFVGTPHIYYGDEIGIRGAGDPDNRRPFDWDWESSPEANDLRSYYKNLILLRKNNPVLIDGAMEFDECTETLLSYHRGGGAQRLNICMNLSEQDIDLPLGIDSVLIFCSDLSLKPRNGVYKLRSCSAIIFQNGLSLVKTSSSE